jgi:hypothetical protein
LACGVPRAGGETGVEVLQLAVAGAFLTGTMTNAVGGTNAIQDGAWDGTTLRFWVPWDAADRLTATGRLTGAALTLDMKTSQWRVTHVFKRVPPDR